MNTKTWNDTKRSLGPSPHPSFSVPDPPGSSPRERGRHRSPRVRRNLLDAGALAVSLPAILLAAIFLPAAALAQKDATESGHESHCAHHEVPAEGAASTEDTATVLRDHQATSLSIPDIELVDQHGEPVRFYSDLVEGKVVAMNFIFTTCTTVCPPMGAIFGKLQQRLGERAGSDVHLISVSIDPTTDTPQRLEEWSKRFGGDEGWTLVTGPKADVDRLLRSLEVLTPNPQDHSPTVLVGDARAGRWQRAYGLTSPAKLVEMLDELTEARAGAAHGDAGAEVGR